MSDQNSRRKFTKDEIRNIILELANELGRPPRSSDVKVKKGLSLKMIAKFFGTYTKALAECGLEASGPGYRVDMTRVFEDWATLVRRLGKLPTMAEFELHSNYTSRVPVHRFGGWTKVAPGLLRYAEENNLTAGWEDVVKVVKMSYPEGMKRASTSTTVDALTLKPKIHPGRRIYGDCASDCLLVFAPTNEMGVIAFFCSIALKLGFFILWIGGQFPDCEVMREIEPGRWQRVLIEFEFYASNFMAHGHDPEKCDMLVCWENDWEKCSLEVLELKPYFFAVKKG